MAQIETTCAQCGRAVTAERRSVEAGDRALCGVCHQGPLPGRIDRMAIVGPVERRTRAEVASMLFPARQSGLGAGAVRLAMLVDGCDSASVAAAALGQLRLAMAELRGMTAPRPAPESETKTEGGNSDDLADRRARRLGSPAP